VTEADKVERDWRGEFEAIIFSNPLCKFPSEADVLAHVVLQAFNPIVPDYKPSFERSEAAPKGNLPVSIVDDRAGFGSLVAQVFG